MNKFSIIILLVLDKIESVLAVYFILCFCRVVVDKTRACLFCLLFLCRLCFNSIPVDGKKKIHVSLNMKDIISKIKWLCIGCQSLRVFLSLGEMYIKIFTVESQDLWTLQSMWYLYLSTICFQSYWCNYVYVIVAGMICTLYL